VVVLILDGGFRIKDGEFQLQDFYVTHLDTRNAFSFPENLIDVYFEATQYMFFILSKHKFSGIAYVRITNFNVEKGKKKLL
jgi:hypothetical protein